MVGAETMEALGRKMLEALKRRLPLHARRIREGRFALLALLVDRGGGKVYLVGAEAPLELLPRGVA